MRKIKISCFCFKKYADLYVNKINFSTDRWLHLFDIFQQINVIVLVEADEETTSELASAGRKQKKNFRIYREDFVVACNTKELGDLFSEIDTSSFDGMFIVSNERAELSDKVIENIKSGIGFAVKNGEADISCTINFPENEMAVSLSKERYNLTSVKKQIADIWKNCCEVDMKNIMNAILSIIYIIAASFSIFYLILDAVGEIIGWDFINKVLEKIEFPLSTGQIANIGFFSMIVFGVILYYKTNIK